MSSLGGQNPAFPSPTLPRLNLILMAMSEQHSCDASGPIVTVNSSKDCLGGRYIDPKLKSAITIYFVSSAQTWESTHFNGSVFS